MEKLYKLELIGITYNQIESGVYALILQHRESSHRIPIIIGFPEAQAIECKLQEIKTPRPLTHDIMNDALTQFGINLDKVIIRRLPNGVFAANLHLSDGVNEKIVDSRSSDGVALAIRMNAPIYTTEEVIMEAGFDPSQKRKPGSPQAPAPSSFSRLPSRETELKDLSLDQLNEAMNKAVEKENYEEAARIKEEINKRKNG